MRYSGMMKSNMAKSELEQALLTQMRWLELPEPAREYQFHQTRQWRFDFAFVEHRVAVEVQGGTWKRGRHTRGQGYEDDCEKLNEATIAGWRVLYVTGKMVNDGRAVTFIERVLQGQA